MSSGRTVMGVAALVCAALLTLAQVTACSDGREINPDPDAGLQPDLKQVPDKGKPIKDIGKDVKPKPDTGKPKGDGFFTKPPCKTEALEKDKEVDVLFVIDNSNSMSHEQQNLAKNFYKFVDAIRTSKLGNKIPNVHIGIVTTDLGAGNYNLPSCEQAGGDQGKLQNKPKVAGCQPPTNPYIKYQDGKTNVPSSSPDPVVQVKTGFQCIAQVGLNGCGFEQTLQSARRALDPTLNVNPGFFRKDALLAVAFISDEDDCSAANSQLYDPSQMGLTDPLGPLSSFRCFEFGVSCQCPKGGKCDRTTLGPRINCVPGGKYLQKVTDLIKFFANLKKTPKGDPHPRRVIMSAIVGPTDKVEVGLDGTNPVLKPSCQSSAGFAVPAIRIKYLVHAFARELTPTEVSDVKSKKKNIPHWIDATGKYRIENTYSICAPDFSPALGRFGADIVAAMGTRCVKP